MIYVLVIAASQLLRHLSTLSAAQSKVKQRIGLSIQEGTTV